MNTLFTGRPIIELDEIPSTNTYAMELLKAGSLTEGTLITALSQTGGRGQRGNTWEAEKGKNLTFSLVIHPRFLAIEQQFYLSKITSLAVLGTLTEFLPASQYDIQIKWPNDVLVNGDKVAGILIENVLPADRGTNLQSSVIGVGINVNQASFGKMDRKAVSIGGLLDDSVDKNSVLKRFCHHFEALYLSLKHGRFEVLNKQYLLNLYQYGKNAFYEAKGDRFEGVIEGVDERGFLVLKAGSEKRQFDFKEIDFLT